VVHVANVVPPGVVDDADVLAVLAGVASSLEVAQCDPLDTLADLGVDSLTLVEFVAGLERRFGVRLSNTELESLGTATVRDICELVRRAVIARNEPDTAIETRVEPRSPVTVRGYRDTDNGVLRRICIEQSALGTLKELAPLFFLTQYCDSDPASCFVAEHEGEIVGYWVGTRDVEAFRRGFLAHLVRNARDVLGWYRRAWSHLSLAEHRRFWHQILIERHPSRRRTAFILRQVGEIYGRTYVHFQIDKPRAPAGTVFTLARAWIDHLRARGAGGALLPSVPGGDAALPLWERLGFLPVKVTRPDGVGQTWLVATLQQGSDVTS
jgi:acyl carrier protein